MKTAVVLALAGAAMSAPTRTIENRQLSGLGSGSGTDSGLDALKSLIPGQSGGLASGLPSLPHFGGLPGLGGSSSGLPSLPHFGGLPGLGDSGDLPSLPTGLPSLSDLEGSSSVVEASRTEKRQFGDLSSLESLIPSLGGSGTSGGGLGALESLIPSGGLSSLESLIPSSGSGGLSSLLGGSSTSGGLSALESLIPGAGSSGLGLKARHQATETDKRQFGDLSSLESLIPGLGGSSTTGGGLSALESLIPSSGGLSGLESLIPSSGSGGLSSLLGGSSTSGGLSALESLIPSSGLGGLGFKARRDASEIEKRQFSLSGSTENGVTSNSGCKELTFIFARGTGELGNMGTVVGPEVAAQLKTLTSDKVTIQGVTYPADAAGNAEMGASGGPAMAKLVKQALSQCPKTKVVLGGYSQGAMVVHNAARSLSSGQISGAVLFGDPFKAQAIANLSNDKRKEFCAMGDPVCENGFNVMAHLTYGSDAKAAAQFLVSAAGLS